MAQLRKMGSAECWQGCGGKETLRKCWWWVQNWAPLLWKTAEQYGLIFKIHWPYRWALLH